MFIEDTCQCMASALYIKGPQMDRSVSAAAVETVVEEDQKMQAEVDADSIQQMAVLASSFAAASKT